MRFISALSAAVLLFSTVPAKAVFYLKPEAGAGMVQAATSGTVSVGGSSVNVSTSASGTGFHAGLGLGYREEYIHLLINPRYYFASVDSQSTGLTVMDFGLGVEWAIPVMTTFMISSATSGDSNVLASTSGYRFSLSYFFSPTFTASFDVHSFSTSASGLTSNVSLYSVSLAQTFEFDYPSKWWREGRGE